ncbi:solute carrier family 30 (zinc transporter), member 2 [Trypanosoma rangeli SC58]|uniref:Solute carrier family 30 (Zinc transporter), member 2 n=2 Tax=Trypanosoma rangeli SC58 TaxID=429131 RepID=A0A061J6W2_TRYRA|nr:solute carrier family 30 (zinc transporter), member 2 [Trypanosoma rangeli SC58]
MQREAEGLLHPGGAAQADYASNELRHDSLSPTPNERVAIENVLNTTEERRRREAKVLYGALIFCFVFMVLEFGSGVLAHSLALLTDAAHLMIDVGAYGLSIMSLKAASKASCGKYNYGWHRAEVIGTLVSVFSIWALVVWIIIEGVTRMWNVVACSRIPPMTRQQAVLGGEAAGSAAAPSDLICEEINSQIMIVVGVLGMVVNVVCAFILYLGGSHGHSHYAGHPHSHVEEEEGAEENIYNDMQEHHGQHDHDAGHDHGCGGKGKGKKGFAVNAALLHALGDCVQSVGVILAGIFIYFTNKHVFGTPSYKYSLYNLADPLCSLFFAGVTLNMTKPLLGDLFGILMESTPPGIDYLSLNKALLSIDGVVSVHDLHVWSLSSDYVALSVHLVADDAATALRKAQYVCEKLFGIGHTTIQVDAVKNGADLCPAACACVSGGAAE